MAQPITVSWNYEFLKPESCSREAPHLCHFIDNWRNLFPSTSEILIVAQAFTGPCFIAAQVTFEGRCIAKKWVQVSTASSQWEGHNFESYYQSSQYWGLFWSPAWITDCHPSAAGSAPLRAPCHCNDSSPFSLFSPGCITECARIRFWNMWADWWQKLALFYLQQLDSHSLSC